MFGSGSDKNPFEGRTSRQSTENENAIFGQGSALFGQQFTTSTSQSTNLFSSAGQASLPMFSNQTSAGSGNIFASVGSLQSSNRNVIFGGNPGLPKSEGIAMGGNSQTTGFGAIASGSSQKSKSTQLFGKPNTVSTDIFGKPSSAMLAAASGSPVTSSKTVQSTASSSQANPFGKPFGQSQPLFGKLAEPRSSSFGSAEQTKSLFSKASEQRSPSFGSAEQSRSLFGKPAAQKASSFGTTEQKTTLFGKPAEEKVAEGSKAYLDKVDKYFAHKEQISKISSEQTRTLSGKPPEEQTHFETHVEQPKSIFHKTSQSLQPTSTTQALFSKPAASWLGKQTAVAAEQSNTLFGKAGKQQQAVSLFGKGTGRPVQKAEARKKESSNLFGKSGDIASGPSGLSAASHEDGSDDIDDDYDESLPGPNSEQAMSSGLTRKNLKSHIENRQQSRRTGLFGKALAEVGKPGKKIVIKRSQAAEMEQVASRDRKRMVRSSSSGEDPERPSSIINRGAFSISGEQVALLAKNVPASCNNNVTLKRHFSKYGEVKRVVSNPNKASAIIHFASHEDALNAKKNGRKVKENLPAMTFFWSAYTPSKEKLADDDSQDSEDAPRPSVLRRKSRETSSQIRLGRNTRDDVENELASLQGTKDIRSNVTSFLKRPGRKATPELDSRVRPASEERTRARSVSPVRTSATSISRKPSPPPARFSASGPTLSFNSLTDTTAHSANEKFTILDNRDKLIRQALNLKNKDWARSTAIKGSCPDMCPERERYMREDRHQLSIYETIPATELVDHARAVKEYSRSSADQDMPLAHELRPSDVLDMTMSYLLNNIADQGRDGMWADWYDFLWNRTRAIRKDITQQHLCNLTTVALVEKCVRFHIYAAHRLCEEPMNCFDMKINNENLTKCLQTLKESYHDMKVKYNMRCPHEAEFRAYMVLMNLNEGDALREAQQLPPEIRQSAEVEFALNAHAALNDNNYVKFFKLLSRASFLQSCILHRYFNQVRCKALMILLRAYGSVTVTAFPLDRLAWLLKFESLVEVEDFCDHYGLTVREGTVMLDKASYINPEAVFPLRRAVQLIEAKLSTSVGEAINGGPLPPNEIHQPCKSFDINGRLIVTSIELPREEQEQSTHVGLSTAVAVAHPPSSGGPAKSIQPGPLIRAADLPFANEVVKEAIKEMFIEVIREESQNVSAECIREARIETYSTELTRTVTDETLPLIMREVAKEVLDEAQKAQQEREARKRAELAAEIAASKERVTVSIINEILEDGLTSLVGQVVQQEYREVQTQLQRESQERVTAVLAGEMLSQVVSDFMTDTLQEFHQHYVVRRLQQLKQAEEAVKLSIVARYFKHWKNELARQQRFKRAILTFPAAPNMDPLPKQIQELVPDSQGLVNGNKIHLGGTAHLSINTPTTVVHERHQLQRFCLAHNLYAKIRHRLAWTPLSVGEIILKQLPQGHIPTAYKHGSYYWKCVLSLPNETQAVEDLPKWLRIKFTKGSVPVDSLSNNKSELLSLYSVMDGRNTVNVCVRCINGDLNGSDLQQYQREQHFQATTSLIHLIYCPPGFSNSPNFWKREHHRLDKVLGVLAAEDIPVMVLLHSDNEEEFDDVQQYLGYLTDYPNVKIQLLESDLDDPYNQNILERGIEWMVKRWPTPPELTCTSLMDYVEDSLSREFFQLVYQDLMARRQTAHLDQPLHVLVNFYNSVVEHLAQVVSDPSLMNYSWPCPEFAARHTETLPPSDWNSSDSLGDKEHIILNLQLPEPELVGAETWEEGCKLVWMFVSAVTDNSINTNDIALYSRIQWLLKKAHREMEDLCDLCWDNFESDHSGKLLSANLPWTEILMACVQHKISDLKLNPTMETMHYERSEVLVIYNSQNLREYHPPDVWTTATRDINVKAEQRLEQSVYSSLKRKHENMEDEPQKQQRLEESTVVLDISPISELELAAKNTLSELERSVVMVRQEGKALDQYLQSVLCGETGSDVSSQTSHQKPVQLSHFMSMEYLSDSTTERPLNISINDEVNIFLAKIKSQKHADKLETMKLERLLMDT